MRARIGLVISLVALLPTVVRAGAEARPLTLEERVDAQRAVEEVYWSLRTWPKDNPGPKPSLSKVLPDEVLRDRVLDSLEKSAALQEIWGRAITPRDLGSELRRMASGTKAPDTLRRLYDALGNDPVLIAETIARPALVDRLIRDTYAWDTSLHAAVRTRAQAGMEHAGSVESMEASGGVYQEATFRRVDRSKGDPMNGVIALDPEAWGELIADLAQRFEDRKLPPGFPARAQADEPFRIPSPLRETALGFESIAILGRSKDTLTLATVRWEKTPFASWWSKVGASYGQAFTAPSEPYPDAPAPRQAACDAGLGWSPTARSGEPVPREMATAVWTGSEMIVFGGLHGWQFVGGDRYDPNTDTWTPLSSVNAPEPRMWHTTVWTGSRMIVWGGERLGIAGRGSATYNNGAMYDPTSDTWTPIAASDARIGHVAVWTGSRMLVFGGGSGSVQSYDPASDTWSASSTAGAPPDRVMATAVWTGSQMIVYGGITFNGLEYPVAGRYDPVADAWGAMPSSEPGGRIGHSAIWTGSEMIIWGGRVVGIAPYRQGSSYNPVTNTWTSITPPNPGSPSGRAFHAAVWTGSRMILWGGETATGVAGDGASYSPSTHSWQPVASIGAPSPRENHVAVWTGSEMIIAFGLGGNRDLSGGGRYNPTTDHWTNVAGGIAALAPTADLVAVSTGAEVVLYGNTSFYPMNSMFVPRGEGARYTPATDTWDRPLESPDSLSRPAAMVWTGTEAIVWGSRYSFGEYFAGLRYNPTTQGTSATADNFSAPYSGFTAVWTGTTALLWGGETNGSDSGGREYDPAGGPSGSWGAIAQAPSGRRGHTAIWTGTTMIVWGGLANSTAQAGPALIYSRSTNTWTQSANPGALLAPRALHTAIWTGTDMILWGGSTVEATPTVYGDGARYAPGLDQWTPISATGAPSPRQWHSVVWTGGRMIVWGGDDGATTTNTGGEYEPLTDTWTPTSLSGAPAPRSWHIGAFADGAMIVWGGTDNFELGLDTGGRYCTCTDYFQDADGDGHGNVADHVCLTSAPVGYVESGDDCDDMNPAVHPGASDASCDGIDENCSGAADEQYVPQVTSCGIGACARTGMSSCVAGAVQDSCVPGAPLASTDATCDGIDDDCSGTADEDYAAQADEWSTLASLLGPVARWRHRGVDAAGYFVVWGGETATGLTSTGGRYNRSASFWNGMSSTNAPSPRVEFTMVANAAQVYVWGGENAAGSYLSTGARYDAGADTWQALPTAGAPTARSRHTAVWTGSKMIVWGGMASGGPLNSGGLYDPSTSSWTSVATAGAPSPRADHAAVWTGTKMIVWGGTGAGGPLGDGALYDPATNSWAPIASAGAPSARSGHTAVFVAGRMIVWGGQGSSGPVATGGLYAMGPDSWSATSTVNAPAARVGHLAVATPSLEMLVWGGSDGTSAQGNGKRYDRFSNVWFDVTLENAPSARTKAAASVASDGWIYVWGGSASLVAADVLDSGSRYHDFGSPCGVGACVRDTQRVCSNGSVMTGCTPGPPATETCNGLDDDCDGTIDDALPPGGGTKITLVRAGGSTNVAWTAIAGAQTYDAVRGVLGLLRSTAGNFTTSTDACIGNDLSATTASDPALPATGNGFWYLVRGDSSCTAAGTYDSGAPSQIGSRDAEIAGAASACP